MDKRDPEGYRKLLAYQKACELQIFTNDFVANLPKTKTFFDLADQMSRSGRSGSKNIVEGWKRNTTKEYFDFLGFSIGAVEELKDDAADIATGVYQNLMGLKGKMGMRQRGEIGIEEQRGIMGKKEMGKKGGMGVEEKGKMGSPLRPLAPLHPFGSVGPLIPLVSLGPISRSELDKIKFYPLDPSLPPIVQLFLKAKEVNYLLYKLQQSLDLKMDNDHTKPVSQRIRENWAKEKQADDEFQKHLKSLGLTRLENGQYIETKEAKGEEGG
jgi:four helix bundle protein